MDISKKLGEERRDYAKRTLLEGDMAAHPMDQFASWLEEAGKSAEADYTAFTIATHGKSGFPQARIVLLKDFDHRGLTFFTNYESDKGREISVNPKIGANFYWSGLERQIRIHGNVSKVTEEESEAYFRSRPRASQIGAWASKQSSVLHSREQLEEVYKELTSKYEGVDVPRPDFWGGYRISPVYMEFWQGRSSRLHDRLAYELQEGNEWVLKRLSP